MRGSVVHKYLVPPTAHGPALIVDLPDGSRAISVGQDPTNGNVAMWVQKPKFEPGQPIPNYRNRKFLCVGTGWDLSPLEGTEHVGSVVINGFVWHVFEVFS